MTSDDNFEFEVNTAAAHILTLLDSVQEQLSKIRATAELLATEQEKNDDDPQV